MPIVHHRTTPGAAPKTILDSRNASGMGASHKKALDNPGPIWKDWKPSLENRQGLEVLIPEVMARVCFFLSLPDIQAVGCLSKTSFLAQLSNTMLWQTLAIRDFGQTFSNEDKNSPTTQIGLARNNLPWKEYFLRLAKSSVFTWGGRRSIGREGDPTKPKTVPELDAQSIATVGKTAEVGSICINQPGTKIFVWGQHVPTPKVIPTSDISTVNGDIVVHCSCGHDSKFMLVMKSGHCFRSTHLATWVDWTPLITPILKTKEQVIWCIGSQNSSCAWVTNLGRLLMFQVDDWSDNDNQTPLIVENPEGGAFAQVAFGHLFYYGITNARNLYQMPSSLATPSGWQKISTDHKVVDVDGGSKHAGFVTDIGEAWTWGSGRDGVLGHGEQKSELSPKRVEWFVENNIQIVAIGCGGHISWEGGFTLFLTNKNLLYMVGRFPSSSQPTLKPTLVELGSDQRHILSISAGEDWAAVVTSGGSTPSCKKQ